MILTILFFIVVGIYLMGLVGRLALGYWIRKKQREFAESGPEAFRAPIRGEAAKPRAPGRKET